MALFSLVLLHTGCEEHFDRSTVNPSEGEMVEVSLHIGFADEADAASLPSAPATKSNQVADKQAAFDMQLQPASQTKTTTYCPDKLYNLDIHQYKMDGTHLASFTVGTVAPGTAITSTLNSNSGAECQLLIIARGATGAVASLSGKSLSEVKAIIADNSKISSVDPSTGTNINNMPYLLFLPKVKISSSGKLVSPEGTDVRLLLKRLAVGLTIDWTFSSDMTSKGYSLTEVRLMQLPKDYRILPERETVAPYGEMYPTSVSEFVDGFRLKGTALTTAGGNNGSQTLWMPANARGVRNDINSPNQRSKEKAHSAATYIEFVVDNSSKNERLLYRAYLGGNATTDFNLLENTNYRWTLNINNANYTADNRIQLLDQTPVMSDNLQPTSNCFMMRPGTDICFNPYLHEAGTSGQNTYLTDKAITKVEVLWQSKDAGTSGDLVLGYAGKDNQKNLVNYTNISDHTNARIHVKVANTQGGNAVIVAYNNSTIVWSWHIWISDYVPVPLSSTVTTSNRPSAIAAAQNATRGGMVHVFGGISWTDQNGSFFKCVIMDRHLGATKGGLQDNELDWVRTFGLLYQGGRKDPMFGTPDGGTDEARTIYDGDGNALSLTKSPKTAPSLDQTIQNPLTFYGASTNQWNGDAAKTMYDPCPKGWRIPSNEYLNNAVEGGINPSSAFQYNAGDSKASLFAGFGYADQTYVAEWDNSAKNNDNIMYYNGSGFVSLKRTPQGVDSFTGAKKSGYLYFGGSGESKEAWTNKSAFFPAAVLREANSGNFRVNSNNKTFMWSSSLNTKAGSTNMQMYEFQSDYLSFQHLVSSGYGFSVRCVQDNIRDRSYTDYKSGN